MNRPTLILISGIALTAMSTALLPQEAKKAEEVYKDIQSFKGLPANEIMPAMKHMSAALGVKCGFCHDEQNWAAPNEHKTESRKMIEMQNKINADFFNNRPEVSCSSCHNGRGKPNAIPNVGDLVLRHKRPTTRSKPEEMFAPYLKAIGTVGSMTLTGATTGEFAQKVELKVSGDKFVLTLDEMKLGFDGTVTWHSEAGKTDILTGADAVHVRHMGRLHLTQATFDTWSNKGDVGTETVAGAECKVLRGALNTERISEEAYFDATSGLLRRMSAITPSVVGRVATYVDFEDYRSVGGAKVPHKLTFNEGGNIMVVQFDSAKATKLEDSTFAPPKG